VTVALDYRYALLKKRGYRFDWYYDVPKPWPSFGYPLFATPSPPYMQTIVDAASGSGWEIESGYLGTEMGLGFSVTKVLNALSSNGSPVTLEWQAMQGGAAADPLQAPAEMCTYASFLLSKRFAQTITETWSITVESPESIAQVGVLETTTSTSAQATFDASAWENDDTLAPVLTVTPANLEAQHAVIDADVTRADVDTALQAMIAIGRVDILRSHRQNRCSFSVPLHPLLDVAHRVAVDCQGVAATGKVFKLVDRINFDAGGAITEIELALSGTGASGLPAPEPIITLPDAPTLPQED
jgi:hypothetical protein